MTSIGDALILLVDDDPLILKTVSRNLMRHGCKVLLAQDAAKAEHHLEAARVTHVLCDYDLGGTQPKGTELIVKWRVKYSAIETACIYTGAGIVTAPLGVDRILHKPTTSDGLLAALGLEACRATISPPR
jgi:DNA-binding response OmpR family regulator